MNADQRSHRTLCDVYKDRELTDSQVRRLVALLGLHQATRGKTGREGEVSDQLATKAA